MFSRKTYLLQMSPTPASIRKLSLFLSSLALTIATPAFAQSTTTSTTTTTVSSSAGSGAVTGAVVEPESGRYLVGAQVSVVGTSIAANTVRGGQ